MIDEGLCILHRERPSSLVHLIAVGTPEVAVLGGVQRHVEQPWFSKGNEHISLQCVMSSSNRSSRNSCMHPNSSHCNWRCSWYCRRYSLCRHSDSFRCILHIPDSLHSRCTRDMIR